jgi:hypothetical protein
MLRFGLKGFLAGAVIALLAMGAAGDAHAKSRKSRKAKKPAGASIVIARVNGEDVTKAEFDEVIKKNRRFFDLTQPDIRTKLKGKKLDEYLFEQEIVRIKAFSQKNAESLPRMREIIEQAQARLGAGEDFAKVAGELSQDAGSAARGGELGKKQGFSDFVHPFNRVALSLKEGEISDPILTVFGYHILKVDKIYPRMEGKPKRVLVRHILIKFPGDPRSEADQAMAAAKVEILETKYCKKLPGYCEGKG